MIKKIIKFIKEYISWESENLEKALEAEYKKDFIKGGF